MPALESAAPAAARAIAPLEVEIERLGLRLRFSWAFHAREVRFERVSSAAGADEDATPLFAETFSFHLEHHDPFEFHLQLEDLWSDPRRIGDGATRRDAQEALRRLLAGVPAYLERVLDGLQQGRPVTGAASVRIHGDLVVLVREIAGFLAEKELTAQPALRLALLHLRKLAWRGACVLVRERVAPETVEAWLVGNASAVAGSEVTSRALLQVLAAPPDARADGLLLLELGARSFHDWLEETCLDESNEAFEGEDSPFDTREQEVLDVAVIEPGGRLRRTEHLSPFLRRLASRDCQRLLRKLEVWFLRRYDVPRAAAVIRHAENLARGKSHFRGTLSWHSTRAYCIAIVALTWPFVGAAFAYERAPVFFDVASSLQVLAVMGAVLWYLLVRFVVQKDLSFFHGAVPRIGAGIIVGYLPVFLIDEVWDLARRPWFPLGVTVTLLGFMTLLYLYVEVRRRIPDPQEAFSRARRIWLLGVLQALGLGVVVTTLLGGFMVSRTWGAEPGIDMEILRVAMPPFLGELPRIMGVEPVYAFPTAVLLMTFLSLFIGTFLQLLWEDLPITEPL